MTQCHDDSVLMISHFKTLVLTMINLLQFVTNESVDEKESEVWRHGDDGEI